MFCVNLIHQNGYNLTKFTDVERRFNVVIVKATFIVDALSMGRGSYTCQQWCNRALLVPTHWAHLMSLRVIVHLCIFVTRHALRSIQIPCLSAKHLFSFLQRFTIYKVYRHISLFKEYFTNKSIKVKHLDEGVHEVILAVCNTQKCNFNWTLRVFPNSLWEL